MSEKISLDSSAFLFPYFTPPIYKLLIINSLY